MDGIVSFKPFHFPWRSSMLFLDGSYDVFPYFKPLMMAILGITLL